MRRFLLLFSIFAALPAARAGETFLAPPALGAMRGSFSPPAVATDGAMFLAAWTATPAGRTPAVMVQRLDRAETELPAAVGDDAPVPFGSVGLAWSGSSYLLVWNSRSALRSLRLDRDGRPIAGSARTVATDLYGPVIAAGPSATMLVARTDYVKNELVAVALDGDDRVVSRTTIWKYAGARYGLAARTGGFLAGIADATGAFFTRFGNGGAWLDAAPQALVPGDPSGAGSVALAGRGSDAVVVWTATRSGQTTDVLAAVVSDDGGVAPRVALPHSGGDLGSLDAVAEAGGYSVMIAYEKDRPTNDFDLEFVRLRPDAAVASGPAPFASGPTADRNGRMARGAAAYGIVWTSSSDASGSFSRIVGTTQPALAAVTASSLLSRTVSDQREPSIAGDGAGYVVAWLDELLDRQQIIAAPLDGNGVPAGAPVALADLPFSYLSTPKVAFGHGMYLVAWNVNGALWGARLDLGGQPLDAAPLRLSGQIGADAAAFDVTAGPEGFFAVWPRDGSIYGAALVGSGASEPVKLTEHAPSHAGYRVAESDPLLAFNGATFLLAYGSITQPPCYFPTCDQTRSDMMTRLDPAGRRLDDAPRPLDAPAIAVVSDGRDFAVQQWRAVLRVDGGSGAITGRVGSGGTARPALVWDGARFVTVWGEQMFDGSLRVTARAITPRWSLAGVARTATIAPRTFSIVAAGNAAGDLLLAYTRGVPDAPFSGTLRTAVQPLGPEVPVVRRPAAGR